MNLRIGPKHLHARKFEKINLNIFSETKRKKIHERGENKPNGLKDSQRQQGSYKKKGKCKIEDGVQGRIKIHKKNY